MVTCWLFMMICPPSGNRLDPVAILVHGLGGDHRSGYMVRVAAKLNQQGVRVFRMDQRGCGAAEFLVKKDSPRRSQ